jgi:hypothetical protein
MSRRPLYVFAAPALIAVVVAACSATGDDKSFPEPTEGAGSTTAAGTGGGASTTQGAGGIDPTTTGGGGTVAPCDGDPAADGDGDGFTELEGDCNNCDKNVSPGAIEVIITEAVGDGGIPEPADEDCDEQIDEVEPDCDGALAIDDTDPINAAKAIDICQVATEADKSWGVLEARYVRANGQPTSPMIDVGLLDGFGSGVSTQKGARMLALSSGNARDAGDPDPCEADTCTNRGVGNAPPGFPQNAPNCVATAGSIEDDVGLELKLRAPTNATGYRYLFKFHSFEYAEYVCTPFNDQFVALVTPPPMGANNGNISFDSAGNPVSVNLGFFDVCDPAGQGTYAQECLFFSPNCPSPPNPYCPSGTAELAGTGFDTWSDAGATSWLQTTAPISGGEEFQIRFAIWDTSDFALDSTVLIDGFEWIANGGTVSVGTDIPDPR